MNPIRRSFLSVLAALCPALLLGCTTSSEVDAVLRAIRAMETGSVEEAREAFGSDLQTYLSHGVGGFPSYIRKTSMDWKAKGGLDTVSIDEEDRPLDKDVTVTFTLRFKDAQPLSCSSRVNKDDAGRWVIRSLTRNG